jgi:hypothetical protein
LRRRVLETMDIRPVLFHDEAWRKRHCLACAIIIDRDETVGSSGCSFARCVRVCMRCVVVVQMFGGVGGVRSRQAFRWQASVKAASSIESHPDDHLVIYKSANIPWISRTTEL